MKQIVMVLLMVLGSTGATSQTLEEWTSQKKTQIKYLLEQIAANNVYIAHLQKGYGIARKGLNTIQHIKKGDFDLHNDFIGSLSNVHPTIKAYVRIVDIIHCQVRIVKQVNATISKLKESNQFTPGELDYTKA